MPTYTNAKYIADQYSGMVISISVEIDGSQSWVPIDPANTDYANMMVLVAEGKLVIAPAEALA
jgi:hypothetical protein